MALTDEQRSRVADVLEKVALGTISADEAIKQADQWTDLPWKEQLLSDAYHALRHFQADADIRSREEAYAATQRAGLLDLAAKVALKG